MKKQRTFSDRLDGYLRACYPILYVNTFEESRCLREISALLARNRPTTQIVEWDCAAGLQGPSITAPDATSFEDMVEVLAVRIKTLQTPLVILAKDLHPYLDSAIGRRPIRSLKNQLDLFKSKGVTLIIVSPVVKIPIELEKHIQLLEYKLPEAEQLNVILDFVRKSTKNPTITGIIRNKALQAACGLTAEEAEDAFSLAYVQANASFGEDFVAGVFDEKIATVRKTGMLQYMDLDVSFNNVGGLAGIKSWVRLRKEAYSEEAREFGLELPKGLLLCGISGTGKSLIAKAIASEFGVPLFQWDIGSLFDKFVGASEQNMRRVITTIEAIGPCVILIDEIEKSLHGGATSGVGDSGTSSRMFATLLSWMNDRTSSAFLVCTSNNHTVLPPELIRRGRLDEAFWIDVPDEQERREIFQVIFQEIRKDLSLFDLDRLVKLTKDFTGAELRHVVKASLFEAFASKKELDQVVLARTISFFKPYASTHAQELSELRAKAVHKLTPVNQIESPDYIEKSIRALG